MIFSFQAAKRNILLLTHAPAAQGLKPESSCNLLCQALLSSLKLPLPSPCNSKILPLPSPCNGCGYCNTQPICRHSDFAQIHNLICPAEIIIVASPIYNLGLPGPLKTFIDRLQPYYTAKFMRKQPIPLKPKKAVLLLTAGRDGQESTAIIKRQLELVFNTVNTTLVGTVLWANLDTNKIFDTSLQQKIKKTAKLLF